MASDVGITFRVGSLTANEAAELFKTELRAEMVRRKTIAFNRQAAARTVKEGKGYAGEAYAFDQVIWFLDHCTID